MKKGKCSVLGKGKDEDDIEGGPAIDRERVCPVDSNPRQGLPLNRARCSGKRGATVQSGG